MASSYSEGNFESLDDCFYSDNENVFSDTEFEDFLEKTKENLFRFSQKSKSRISIGKEDPLKDVTFSKHLNSAANEPLDSFKNFVSDLQNSLQSPVKNVEKFNERLSKNISSSIDVRMNSSCEIDHNDSDLGFSKFITQLQENLEAQKEINHKHSNSSTSPDDASTEDFGENPRKKNDLQSELKYDHDSSDESLNSSQNTSSDDSEGEDFEKFISTMKSNLQSKYMENSTVPLNLKSKYPLRSQRSHSFSNEGFVNQADTISKRSKSVTSHSEFNLIDAEAEAGYIFMKKRNVYATQLYHFFNKTVFNNRLPENMLLKWSGQLKSTAGKAFCQRIKTPEKSYEYSCHIELSTEVLISFDRLRDTLIHEMCHAACWLINHSYDKHGPLWKTWASRCSLILPQIKVPTRCHEYELSYAYKLKCVKCDYVCKRHHMCPKLKRKVCPKCRSPTILTKE